MFNAGRDVGFNCITFKGMYEDPEHAKDPAIREFMDKCGPTDYIFKFTWRKD
jgi:hypothetical protein